MSEQTPFQVGKNRIESLGDGLFAVAMTLLVLSIKLPAFPHEATVQNEELRPELIKLARSFGAYGIAFIGLGVYWVLHHMVFHAVRAADRVLLWLTIFFFMFVSVLPLSVQLVNQYPEAQVTSVIFGFNLAIVGWLLYLQWGYVSANPRLTDERTFTSQFREVVGRRVLFAPVVATLTTIICFWSPSISAWIYLGMLPFYLVPGDELRRRGRSVAPGDPEAASTRSVAVRHVRTSLLWVAITIAAGIGWAAFRPETLFLNHRVNDPLPASGSMPALDVVAAGTFRGVAHETHGKAVVLKVGPDKLLLRLQDISTSNGPDVHVYLVAAPEVRDNETVRRSGYVDLGSMKGNEGNQNYELPADCDLRKFRSVVIWCDRFKVNFASAPLIVGSGKSIGNF